MKSSLLLMDLNIALLMEKNFPLSVNYSDKLENESMKPDKFKDIQNPNIKNQRKSLKHFLRNKLKVGQIKKYYYENFTIILRNFILKREKN